ncbi:hypothetical protein [Propionicimonas sp.]|uniref:hypothetical protein n=1 Tax=Propionicimonas sp. TaxID=1955623 RepID=UPI00185AC87A|nr:hypothetical protein [Propionicimonas sp.]MBU3975425.1 hypothetical protein [Actinomycetota bacterium]MBA3020169.1 hypothetical protein [Propionicimonas sp.]MBU3986426.1 hypothetical protein [Actinomycetota bacterium]MBU4007995.1 hypothetical protein [Actinomycetota bacterium]MBU4064253.1 hypothetical protein [Actinomycetota bacterium]
MSSVQPPPGLIESHLSPTERLLWAGRPGARSVFRLSDVMAGLVGIAFIAVAVPMLFAFGGARAPIYVQLFLLFFVLVGLSQLVGPSAMRAWQLPRTWYALTDQRALELVGDNVRSVRLNQVEAFDVTTRADGSGTIVFVRSLGLPPQVRQMLGALQSSGVFRARGGSASGSVLAFYHVADVAAVEALVNSYRQGLR